MANCIFAIFTSIWPTYYALILIYLSGVCVMFLFGYLFDWRTVALVSSSCSIITFTFMTQVRRHTQIILDIQGRASGRKTQKWVISAQVLMKAYDNLGWKVLRGVKTNRTCGNSKFFPSKEWCCLLLATISLTPNMFFLVPRRIQLESRWEILLAANSRITHS